MGWENINTIIAVVKNYHARRSLMTLRRHLPAHIKLKAAPYTSAYDPFTKESWHEIEYGIKKVTGEMEKIKKYMENGDLAELE